MKLTWYGHACFLLETEQGSAVFDPYAPGTVPGLSLPELDADIFLSSHGHSDHYYPRAVNLSGRKPHFKLEAFPCWHDEKQGDLRGDNTMHLVEAEGLRLLHMGDLGHMLSPRQIEQLGLVDVLMIPVGGYYTIGPEAAARLVKAIKPRICIPMHYRGEGFGFDNIAPVESFTALADGARYMDTNSIDPAGCEGGVLVLSCPVNRT